MKEQKYKESDSNLKKSIPQLLDEFMKAADQAYLNVVPRETQVMLDAQRCMVTMMAQVAMKNEKLTNQIKKLTWLIFIIGFLTLGFTIYFHFCP